MQDATANIANAVRVRRAGAAHRLRREWDQVLREAPNRRKVVGGSEFVATVERRLAEDVGGTGGSEKRSR